MPIASHSNQTQGDYEAPVSSAGSMQIIQPEMPVPVPATIAASGSWLSGIIYATGYKNLSVGVTLTQAGTLKINRYIDTLGNVPQAVSSTAIVANTALIVNLTDGVPFVTYQIEIDNGGGSTATVSNFTVLMTAV